MVTTPPDKSTSEESAERSPSGVRLWAAKTNVGYMRDLAGLTLRKQPEFAFPCQPLKPSTIELSAANVSSERPLSMIPTRSLGGSMPSTRKRRLNVEDILAWATRYRESSGRWPTRTSGEIPGTLGVTWFAVDAGLRNGTRGLPGGSSLAQLLAARFGARNVQNLPPLTEQRILAWADAYHERTGSWPSLHSGTIPESGGERWLSVDHALRVGLRGLEGHSSLARLLAQQRGVRNRKRLPPLTEETILVWADAWQERTGQWPTSQSGSIPESPGETWLAVDMALRHGQRGMVGGSSLALLLADKRDVRNVWSRPNLCFEQILAWADAHNQRCGHWPHLNSGPIPEAPDETWLAVNQALKRGMRGLPGGYSLADFLAVKRGARNRVNLPPLSRKEILRWATAFHRARANGPRKRLVQCPRLRGTPGTRLTRLCISAGVACAAVHRWPACWIHPARSVIVRRCPACPTRRSCPGPMPIFAAGVLGRTRQAA